MAVGSRSLSWCHERGGGRGRGRRRGGGGEEWGGGIKNTRTFNAISELYPWTLWVWQNSLRSRQFMADGAPLMNLLDKPELRTVCERV